jgi:protein-tyrosine phosphatase
MRTVLFLCTGNYYRSRFAELYFNAAAAARGLPWRADSRGLRLYPGNVGPVSRHTLRWLARHGVPAPAVARPPLALTEADLHTADLVVAVKEAEHRPLLELNFPAWAPRVEFWHVHDVDCAEPTEALPELTTKVDALLERLTGARQE